MSTFTTRKSLSRRTLLRGVGATLSLPFLDAMVPAATAATRTVQPAKRISYIYIPMGCDQSRWTPGSKDTLADLSPILKSLEQVKQHCTVISNLELEPAYPGTHATSNASFLSAARVKHTESSDYYNGTTADQIAANHLGLYTALPSLELACKPDGPGSEIRQEGLTNRYYQTVSFRTATQPLPMERSPAEVYKRLFASRQSTPKKKGNGPGVDAKQFAADGGAADESSSLDRSMLDLVRENAGELRKRVSVDDQHRLDDYLDSVSSLEKRVGAIERQQVEAAK